MDAINERDSKIAESNENIQLLISKVESYETSNSWKLTKPL